MAGSADTAIGVLGVDLDANDASALHDEGLELNTLHGRAVYAQAAANSPRGSLCYIAPASAAASASAVATLVSTGNLNSAAGYFAINQVDVSANRFGWFYTEGRQSCVVRTGASCAPNLPLYTTATGGQVDDATVSASRLQGLRIIATATVNSASAYEAVFHNITNARTYVA